jgi:hypothetical protein
MVEITQLEQLIVFAECGTLSKAAEELHISQPTLTRPPVGNTAADNPALSPYDNLLGIEGERNITFRIIR